MARTKANWGYEQEQYIESLLDNYEQQDTIDLTKVAEHLGYSLTSVRKYMSLLARDRSLSVTGIWTHETVTITKMTEKEREIATRRIERERDKAKGIGIEDTPVRKSNKSTFVLKVVPKVGDGSVILKVKAVSKQSAEIKALNTYGVRKILSTHTHEEYKRTRKSYGLLSQREYV